MPATPRAFARARRSAAALAIGVLAAGMLSACGGNAAGSSEELRLGYFPNVTHAAAVAGVKDGTFQEELGATELKPQTFNAGPAVIEALNAGGLDAAYIGANPAINGFAQSDGESLRVISGATSRGASLVVRSGITDPAQLEGLTLGSPQLGNTQDVALRYYLQQQGFETERSGGGDVAVIPAENAVTYTQFQRGDIDGAWVPEPWASRLVDELGGEVLVNEADLWPEGEFVTTHLIVSRAYLEAHPAQVEALLRGHVRSTEWINENTAEAKELVNSELEVLTSKSLSEPVLDRAWDQLNFTTDPFPSTLQTAADHAGEVDLLDPVDLTGIYDLTLLNKVLVARDQTAVSAGGLGKD
jgi:NitT/TauT family transport system substrate-binding protein